jgi:hypothetical protein
MCSALCISEYLQFCLFWEIRPAYRYWYKKILEAKNWVGDNGRGEDDIKMHLVEIECVRVEWVQLA